MYSQNKRKNSTDDSFILEKRIKDEKSNNMNNTLSTGTSFQSIESERKKNETYVESERSKSQVYFAGPSTSSNFNVTISNYENERACGSTTPSNPSESKRSETKIHPDVKKNRSMTENLDLFYQNRKKNNI